MTHTGRCLCGDIRFRAEGDPDRVVHCHCSMCRRQSGAAFLTFARFPRATVRFLSGEPRPYRSSLRATRGFCARCGSTLTFSYKNEPAHLWFTAGSLHRADELVPTSHVMADQRMPWLRFDVEDLSVARRPWR